MKTTLKKFIQNYCNDNKLVLIDNQFLDDCICNIEINSNEISIKRYKKYTYIKYRGLKYVVKIIDSMFIIKEHSSYSSS